MEKLTTFVFDATTVAEFNGDDVLAAGTYLMKIVDAEITKSKNGEDYLKIVWEVADGVCKGRKVFHNLFIFNKNEQFRAQSIGYFARICKVLRKEKIRDFKELFNIICKVVVIVKTNKEDYTFNELKKFLFADEVVPDKIEEEDVPF